MISFPQELVVVDINNLVDRIDSVLADDHFEDDTRRTAVISVELCEAIFDELNVDQQGAVVAARRYLKHGVEVDRAKYVSLFAELLDSGAKKVDDAKMWARNRLVWAALNNNTGLSSYACEFLIGIGADAGLSIDQISSVFQRNIQGLDGAA